MWIYARYLICLICLTCSMCEQQYPPDVRRGLVAAKGNSKLSNGWVDGDD